MVNTVKYMYVCTYVCMYVSKKTLIIISISIAHGLILIQSINYVFIVQGTIHN